MADIADEMNTEILALRAQVARLEAANAAKDAALRTSAEAYHDTVYEEWGAGHTGSFPKCLAERCVAARAALSPDAGKSLCTCGPADLGPHFASDHAGTGWLPPEVREQVLRTGKALLAWIDRPPLEPFDGDPVTHSMGLEEDFHAALDALEVK